MDLLRGRNRVLLGSGFAPGATLALSFTTQQYRLGSGSGYTRSFAGLPGLTVNRPSPGWIENPDSSVSQFANGVSRISSFRQGLLVEESRAELVANNRFQDWTGLLPNGYTCSTPAHYGQSPGVFGAFALKVIGPFSNDGTRIGFNVLSAWVINTIYAAKIRVRKTRGSGTANLTVAFDSWGSSIFQFDLTATPINQWVTLSTTATTPGVAPAQSGGFHTNGTDADFEIDWFQIEQGAFSTSVMANDTQALFTRAADLVSLALSPAPNMPVTLVNEFVMLSTTANVFATVIGVDGNSYKALRYNGSQFIAIQRKNGQPAGDISLGGVATSGQIVRMAARFASGNQGASLSGGAVATAADTLTDINFPEMDIGSLFGSAVGGASYIRKVLLYPRGFGNAEVQAATS